MTDLADEIAARDLARYYALLERERPGELVSPAEVGLIRAALPSYRAARRDGGETTLAAAVAAHAAYSACQTRAWTSRAWGTAFAGCGHPSSWP